MGNAGNDTLNGGGGNGNLYMAAAMAATSSTTPTKRSTIDKLLFDASLGGVTIDIA